MFVRIWAFSQKELIQLFRDRRTLIFLLLGPLMMLILFTSAVHTDIKNIPIVVVDQDKSISSQRYLDAFITSGIFQIIGAVSDAQTAQDYLKKGVANMAIIIPPDFSTRLTRGDAKTLLLIDGSTTYTTQIAVNSANSISQQYAGTLLNQNSTAILSPHIQILFNPDVKDLWLVTPAFIALLMQVSAMNMTSYAIVREREVGTIESILVTPVKPIELMLAKTVPTFLVVCSIGFLLSLISIFILRVPFRGNAIIFCIIAVISALCGIGLGLLISTLVQTINQSVQLTALVNVSCMFLGGVLFPTYSMPKILRLIGGVFPVTYSVPMIRGVFLKNLELPDLSGRLLPLCLILFLMIWLATLVFKQNLE